MHLPRRLFSGTHSLISLRSPLASIRNFGFRNIWPAFASAFLLLSGPLGRAQQAPPPGYGYGGYGPGYGAPAYQAPPAYGQPYQQPYPQQYSQPNYAPQQPTYPPQQIAPDAGQAYAGQQDLGNDPGYAQDVAPDDAPPLAPQQPLNVEQLEQLVAPIALYPDTLVAQILAAATYPAQVVDADHWRQSQGYAGADQIVYGANTQPWDPSVKGLTAFPQVLDEMSQNLQWTVALGNAYFNQPQDVLDVVQVMRQRAQAAGNLQSTPQESVSYDQGYIQLAPPDPNLVYLPAYDPWSVYGQPVTPYPHFSLLSAIGSVLGSAFNSGVGGRSGFGGGSGLGSGIGSGAIRFGLGIAMSAFNHSPWGLLEWGLSWLTHSVLFHQSPFYSNSTTVADWGLPRGGPRVPGYREHHLVDRSYASRGQLNARNDNAYRNQSGSHNGYSRFHGGSNTYTHLPGRSFVPASPNVARAYGDNRQAQNGYRDSLGYRAPLQANGGSANGRQPDARSGMQAYNHVPQQPMARPQQNGQGGWFNQYNRGTQSYGYSSRSGSGYAAPYAGNREQTYRGATPSFTQPGYQNRSYQAPSFQARSEAGNVRPAFSDRALGSYGGRGSDNYSEKQSRSGAFGSSRGFNGDHEMKEPKAPKAPKMPKEKSYKGGGGGHSRGGGLFGNHAGGGHRR